MTGARITKLPQHQAAARLRALPHLLSLPSPTNPPPRTHHNAGDATASKPAHLPPAAHPLRCFSVDAAPLSGPISAEKK